MEAISFLFLSGDPLTYYPEYSVAFTGFPINPYIGLAGIASAVVPSATNYKIVLSPRRECEKKSFRQEDLADTCVKRSTGNPEACSPDIRSKTQCLFVRTKCAIYAPRGRDLAHLGGPTVPGDAV